MHVIEYNLIDSVILSDYASEIGNWSYELI